MSVTDIATRREMSVTDKRDAARRDVAADPSVTGATLGERYEMTAAWGRKQKRVALEGAQRDAAPDRDTGAPAGVAPPVTVPVPRHDPPSELPAEPVSRDVPRHLQAVRLVTIAGVLVVACTAAAISYAHMRHLALQAGEGWRADILPLSVDGMMVVASMTALSRRRAGRSAWLAWLALGMGVAASMAANIASAQPTLEGRLMAAWPPLALVVAFELLLQQGREEP